MWETVATEKKAVVVKQKGRINNGTYGRDYIINEHGDEIKVVPRIVRGRGRPKLNTGETGKEFTFDPDLLRLQILWSGNTEEPISEELAA